MNGTRIPELFPRGLATLAGLIVLATLLSCGGGGSGGGLVSGGGGIGGTGQSLGELTGFGSIFVNGIRWDVTGAVITIEEGVATEADLALGMFVTVSGVPDAAGGTGTAVAVDFDSTRVGPIESIGANPDDTSKTLEVLGAVVIADRDTTTYENVDYESLAVDDVIEVSGVPDDSGALRATRVERLAALQIGTTEVKVKGTIASFDGVSSFEVGGVSVTFDPTGSLTDLDDLPGGVADGLTVEVEGVLVAASSIDATDLDLEVAFSGDFDAVSAEGFITGFNGLGDFRIVGIRVDASAAVLDPASPAVFGNGARVRVRGPAVGGVIVAEALELRSREVKIHAQVASSSDIDVSAGTVRLLGVEIAIDASTLLEDDRDGVPGFDLADLAVGDFLEVRGTEIGTGRVIATRLERDDLDDVILQGRVEAFDAGAGTITILGLTVPTGGSTDFEDEDDVEFPDAASFFAALAVGDLVKVKDDEDGDETQIDVADEVELERED